jgi:hemerythrin-like domain-containing protein
VADVFEVLASEHAEIQQMLAELEREPAGGTGDQLMRKKMAERLAAEESGHEALEEMFFWPAIREHMTGGDAFADEAAGQEQAGREVLDELDRTEAGDPRFERLLATFIQAAREHIKFEEETVWPRAWVALPADVATMLGERIIEGKKAMLAAR